MQQLEVIATDGKVQKRILWIDIRPNGVYYGSTSTGGHHISYHVDGNLFETYQGKTQKIGKLRALNELKGATQFSTFVFSSDLSGRLNTPDYKLKPLHSISYVDVRRYRKEKCFVGVGISVVEPENLPKLDPPRPPFVEAHLFMEFKPWILIYFYKATTTLFD